VAASRVVFLTGARSSICLSREVYTTPGANKEGDGVFIGDSFEDGTVGVETRSFGFFLGAKGWNVEGLSEEGVLRSIGVVYFSFLFMFGFLHYGSIKN